MRHYEVVVMVNAEQHERGTAMAERYQTMVADDGGNVHRFEDWGSRRLAYPIGKRLRARYFLFNIECGADTLNKLKDDFRYSESVIRSLVLRCETAIAADSPIITEMKRVQEEENESNESNESGEGQEPRADADAEVTPAEAAPAGEAGGSADAKADAEAEQQENNENEKE